jgi:hypothetical protein
MYEINVLVNGSRCKQYNHNGKLFVEAKKGSEYSIEIKNDTWQRILAVCSVDGLDILNGKTAEENGNGYVINGYGSLKADGFRVSNEKVAKFLFDYKGGSYAASKEDGSEKNVGVIGVRIFTEKIKPQPPVIIREEHHHHDHYPKYPPYPNNPWYNRPYWWDNTTIWCGGMTGDGDTAQYGNSCCNSMGDMASPDSDFGGEHLYSCDNIPTKGAPLNATPGRKRSVTKSINTTGKSEKVGAQKLNFMGNASAASNSPDNVLRAMNCAQNAQPLGFDMGTKWGEAKESRVIEVEFEKGILALTTNIYYASRQSLIEMGVPLGNEKQVSFPEPFKDGKYAEPPKNWQG